MWGHARCEVRGGRSCECACEVREVVGVEQCGDQLIV